MIESDPLSTVVIAHEATQMVMHAGPPSDLPSQVPDFVGNILDAIGNFTGEGGLGDRISDLTSGGNETADDVGDSTTAGVENTSS